MPTTPHPSPAPLLPRLGVSSLPLQLCPPLVRRAWVGRRGARVGDPRHGVHLRSGEGGLGGVRGGGHAEHKSGLHAVQRHRRVQPDLPPPHPHQPLRQVAVPADAQAAGAARASDGVRERLDGVSHEVRCRRRGEHLPGEHTYPPRVGGLGLATHFLSPEQHGSVEFCVHVHEATVLHPRHSLPRPEMARGCCVSCGRMRTLKAALRRMETTIAS
mmetsp:Transcript_40910/g.96171  ORF Transcript_40910/g.96171 Transcript_40910/m.96171 type:complete len:215 (-) Transcript_40910:1096-1740(-)